MKTPLLGLTLFFLLGFALPAPAQPPSPVISITPYIYFGPDTVAKIKLESSLPSLVDYNYFYRGTHPWFFEDSTLDSLHDVWNILDVACCNYVVDSSDVIGDTLNNFCYFVRAVDTDCHPDSTMWSFSLPSNVVCDFDYPLYPGWNLVSMPVTRANGDRSARDLLPGAQSPIWGYSAATVSYLPAESLAAGRGYWALSTTASVAQFYGQPSYDVVCTLLVGWNLISGAFLRGHGGGVPAESLWIVPPGAVDLASIYRYDASLHSYAHADTLQAGRGYFILSSSGAILRFRR